MFRILIKTKHIKLDLSILFFFQHLKTNAIEVLKVETQSVILSVRVNKVLYSIHINDFEKSKKNCIIAI